MFFEFDHVSFAYGNIKALDDLSFSGEKGEIIGLIGENGAGKSTAIKNIVRYLQPDKGHIYLDGQDIFRIRPAKISCLVYSGCPCILRGAVLFFSASGS